MKRSYLVVLSIAAMSFAPCFAQIEIDKKQPVVIGPLNKMEARIQSKLTAYYNNGQIDSAQLAELQRDFDGILDKENEMQTQGTMDSSGKKTIYSALTQLEIRLDRAILICN